MHSYFLNLQNKSKFNFLKGFMQFTSTCWWFRSRDCNIIRPSSQWPAKLLPGSQKGLQFCDDSDTVISPLNENGKSVPLKRTRNFLQKIEIIRIAKNQSLYWHKRNPIKMLLFLIYASFCCFFFDFKPKNVISKNP